ncbi:GRP family sugar transporter [Fibrobacter sp. UWB11]|uniref:GRP family sugar transporter n=1 Tax=Fibrobacter sp. UWB11 TaxID=1896202 RepID=UPI0020C9ECE8|nr:GRP family sugar transporter [Fibrobacter sp. UWB11]
MGNSYVGLVLAVFAFGTYMVPLKAWSKFSSWAYLSCMALGMFLGQLAISIATDTLCVLPVGLLCGFFWVCAGAFCFWAVKAEQDLTGAGVRSMGVSILASFISGVLVFSESTLLYFSIPAILLLLFGLSRLAPPQGNIFRNWRSLLGGLIFGLYLIPYKFAEVPILEFMSSFSIGIFVAAELLVAILCIKRRALFEYGLAPSISSMLMGILWVVGQHGCFWAIDTKGSLGYAVGYPLTQLNLLVNLLWGVVVFGEYPTKPERIKLAIAVSVILCGGALLALSKM